MNEATELETYLIISQEKFEIYLLDIKNLKNLYKNEFNHENHSEKLDLNILNEFLEKNIFKIEKVAGNFVNNINVIIENNSTLNFDLSVKRKNYSGNISNIFLENMLTDIKDLFKERYSKYKLIHMIINKYIIDDMYYFSMPNKISTDKICLEIKLISISKSIIFDIENILKKYQIRVNNYYDKLYLESFLKDEKIDISQKAHKLHKGMNNNEVQITSKSIKKLGFFEKFFQLFS